jgi:hypothetical protein
MIRQVLVSLLMCVGWQAYAAPATAGCPTELIAGAGEEKGVVFLEVDAEKIRCQVELTRAHDHVFLLSRDPASTQLLAEYATGRVLAVGPAWTAAMVEADMAETRRALEEQALDDDEEDPEPIHFSDVLAQTVKRMGWRWL